MRIKLKLGIDRKYGSEIPLNYQYYCSSVVYKIISYADKKYATFLHDKGIQNTDKKKNFKFFTFSRLMIPEYKIIYNHAAMKILSDTIDWEIAFSSETTIKDFIKGIFQNRIFQIGNERMKVNFTVINIEVPPEPEFSEEMTFHTMSPIVTALKRKDGTKEYIAPNNTMASYLIFNGLIDRLKAFTGNQDIDLTPVNCFLTVLNRPKSVLIAIKEGTPQEIKVRGFMCDFKVKASVPIMKMIYSSGIGCMNSMGFGCVGIIKK